MSGRFINIARWISRSRANGPGERFVLWVQGCGLACEGCWNPDTWSFAPRQLLTPDQLLREVDRAGGIEGITLSGGEPFTQAEALVPFVESVRSRGLSVLVFTGFERAELRSRVASRLLALTDVLVAGRYDHTQVAKGLRLLGSQNQRIHFLSGRYGPEDLDDVARCEAHIAPDGVVTWTGFPGEFVNE